MPSPITVRLPASLCGTKAEREVGGYCNRRKDSLGWYKDEGGQWIIIHRASGYVIYVNPARKIKSYTDFSNVCQMLQDEAYDALKELDTCGWQFGMTPIRSALIAQIQAVLNSKFPG